MAYQTVDPILVATEVVGALQSIASRNTHPLDSVVVSVTQIHAGDAYNVITPTVAPRGTVRTYRDDVTALAAARMRQNGDGITPEHGGRGAAAFRRAPPRPENTEPATPVPARGAGG